jgi:hypothetical protein
MRRGWRTERLENSVRERRPRNRETARDKKEKPTHTKARRSRRRRRGRRRRQSEELVRNKESLRVLKYVD